MKTIKQAFVGAAVAGLLIPAVFAQDGTLMGRYQQQVDAIKTEMVQVSRDIDEGVEQILSMIIPLADSKDTGNDVTQLKQSTIQSLRKVIDAYAMERQKLEGDLARPVTPLTKSQMAGEVEAIDNKIDQRIDDILRISESLARNKEFEKYDTWYDYEDDVVEQEVNQDYRQNQRVQRRVVSTRGDLAEGLNASITSLNNRLARYKQALSYQTTPENTEALRQLIDETSRRIDERRQQLISLGEMGGEEGARTIGKRDLQMINNLVNQQKAEIKASFDHLRRLKTEYDQALIRLNDARRMAP